MAEHTDLLAFFNKAIGNTAPPARAALATTAAPSTQNSNGSSGMVAIGGLALTNKESAYAFGLAAMSIYAANQSIAIDELFVTESMGHRRGNMPGNNQAQNKQVRDVTTRLGLSPDEVRQLHDAISGLGLGYKEIYDLAKELFNK